MAVTSSTMIIIIVALFAGYLAYSHYNQQRDFFQPIPNSNPNRYNKLPGSHKHLSHPNGVCPVCQDISTKQDVVRNRGVATGERDIVRIPERELEYPPIDMSPTRDVVPDMYDNRLHHPRSTQPSRPTVQATNIAVDTDPYADPIKKQDLYTLYDPLTYPQLRLPREVLDRYNDYQERTGVYPPFNQATQPLFDNPILNGLLIKHVDDNDPFSDNVPNSIPLFRVRSSRNTNRYFYYVLDLQHLSKIELKVPLDHVRVNGVRYNNADFYGIPELFDGDCVESIPLYPHSKFRVMLYKTYHFP